MDREKKNYKNIKYAILWILFLGLFAFHGKIFKYLGKILSNLDGFWIIIMIIGFVIIGGLGMGFAKAVEAGFILTSTKKNTSEQENVND